MADTRLYRMTLEEVKEFIALVEPEWKDIACAKEHLHIAIYDNRHIDYHTHDECDHIVYPNGEVILGYEVEEQSNSIRYDKSNRFMYHFGIVTGTVQLVRYDEKEGCYVNYQLSNAFAEYWGASYEDIWIAAVGHSVLDFRFMAWEDTSGEVIEIAEPFVCEAVRMLRKRRM